MFPDKCVPLHSQIRNEAQNKHRGVEQLVARQAHNLEVTCSSRVSATILKRCKEFPYTSFSFVVVQLLLVRVSRKTARRNISGDKLFYYFCIMKLFKQLASLMFPSQILEYFDVVKVEEGATLIEESFCFSGCLFRMWHAQNGC